MTNPVNRIHVGIVIACVILFSALSFWLCLKNFLQAGRRSYVARVKADQRSMSTALETYFVDHGAYPPPVAVDNFIDSARLRKRYGTQGLSVCSPALTTPVTYITALFSDPFTRMRTTKKFLRKFKRKDRWSFGYYTDERTGWMLYSMGTDLDYDIRPGRDLPTTRSLTREYLLPRTYDPKNGDYSDGDIWRLSDGWREIIE